MNREGCKELNVMDCGGNAEGSYFSVVGVFKRSLLWKLGGVVAVAIAVKGVQSIDLSPPEKPTPEMATQALVGKWRALGGDGLNGIRTIVFKDNGEAWLVTPDKKAVNSSFWTEPSADPMPLDILSASGKLRMTSYVFVDGDTIRILPMQTGLQQMRHAGVEKSGVVFQRKSDDTELDKDVVVLAAKPPAAELSERHVEQYMNTLIFAERDYFHPDRKFATQLSDMNPGFTDSLVGYRFEAVPWKRTNNLESPFRNVTIQAIPPAAGMNSFAALLSTGKGFSSAIRTCRSGQPSMEPPEFKKDRSGTYHCAPGTLDL